jgi:ABC-type transport system involved in cytochrome bd biosynthesis fused ATPase/permease subunit
VGVTGPVGAGSGTLLDLLYGLRPFGEGMIFFNGQDLKHSNIHDVRSKVVFLRGVELFEGSIYDNLCLNDASLTLSAVNEALNEVGLLERVRLMPEGVQTLIQPGGRPFSDAERIKLCMARAFLAQPALIMIDKFLDGLDPEASRTLFETVFSGEKKCTILIATRDRDILQRCSRVFRLHDKGTIEVNPGSLTISDKEGQA